MTQKQLYVRFLFSEIYLLKIYFTISYVNLWLLLKSGFHRTLCLKISDCPFPGKCSSQGENQFYSQYLLEHTLIKLLL